MIRIEKSETQTIVQLIRLARFWCHYFSVFEERAFLFQPGALIPFLKRLEPRSVYSSSGALRTGRIVVVESGRHLRIYLSCP